MKPLLVAFALLGSFGAGLAVGYLNGYHDGAMRAKDIAIEAIREGTNTGTK